MLFTGYSFLLVLVLGPFKQKFCILRLRPLTDYYFYLSIKQIGLIEEGEPHITISSSLIFQYFLPIRRVIRNIISINGIVIMFNHNK